MFDVKYAEEKTVRVTKEEFLKSIEKALRIEEYRLTKEGILEEYTRCTWSDYDYKPITNLEDYHLKIIEKIDIFKKLSEIL